LSLAHFYFWWYYFVQDELLDGDASPAALLSGHLALLKMIETYANLGSRALPIGWTTCNWRSVPPRHTPRNGKTRFTRLDEVTPDRFELFTLDFIGDRAVPSFSIPLPNYTWPIPTPTTRAGVTCRRLHCFILARQIGDDASDWLVDLQAGRLNYVSAHLFAAIFPIPWGCHL